MSFFRKKKKKEAVRMKMRGFPGDVDTCKCLLMASEKNVDLDVEVLDAAGVVSLEEDDFSTTSVNAVLSFLDIRGGANTLLNPKKAQFYGHQNYWGQVARTVCEPALKTLIDAKIHGESGGDTEAACATINGALDELNKFIDNKKYIVGDYSFADVHWTAVAHMLCLVGAEESITSRSNLNTWFDRVKARPSYAVLPSLDDVKNKQLRSVA